MDVRMMCVAAGGMVGENFFSPEGPQGGLDAEEVRPLQDALTPPLYSIC
jgi:hypothetical protein